MSALLGPFHVLSVSACSESVRVFVYEPKVSPAAEQITPIPPYKGQKRGSRKELQSNHNGPMNMWLPGCETDKGGSIARTNASNR